MEELESPRSSRNRSSTASKNMYRREQWSNQFEFTLACLGYAVGLGSLWRFPYLAYKNGGGAFVIPYFISLLVLGMPTFLLELALGQYTSSGPATCWEFCNLVKGCGLSMTLVSILVSIYFNVIIAWALFFFFASFTSELPWATCGNWSSKYCSDRIRHMTAQQCRIENGTLSKGLCVTFHNKDHIWMVDREVAKTHGINIVFPTMEYFSRRVTGASFGDINNPGPPRGDLLLCLILAWVLVAAGLSRGIKSFGKVVYMTATATYLILFALLFRGLTLEGSSTGILYYVTPRVERIHDANIWKDAAVQVFFSLSVSFGGHITLASYNKFNNDIMRDALIVSMGSSLTSIVAGFVIFAFMGFLSHNLRVPIDDVTTGGVSLAFGMYPFCLTKLPSSSLWSAVFFFMIISISIDSQFFLVETVITYIVDLRPELRTKKSLVMGIVCVCTCLMGVSMTTNAGTEILTAMDTYSSGWNVLVLSAVESFAISWVYGADKFVEDIDVMIGGYTCKLVPFKSYCGRWWKLCWGLATPAFALFVIILTLADYSRIEQLPWWVDIIGWGISISSVGIIVLVGVINFLRAEGTISERLSDLTTPSRYWGPLLTEHRVLVHRIRPEMALDPHGCDYQHAPLELQRFTTLH